MLTILLLDYAPRKWKPNVAARHAARIDAYIVPLIGKEKLSTLTPKRLERFFLEVQDLPQIGNPSKKVSLCVVGKIKSLLNTAMKEAYRLQYITKREQADVVSLAACDTYSSEERTIWTQEEYLRAVETAQPLQMRVWLKLSAQASARIGENLGLKWADVKFQPDGSAAITYRWQLQRIAREEMEGNQKIVLSCVHGGAAKDGVRRRGKHKPDGPKFPKYSQTGNAEKCWHKIMTFLRRLPRISPEVRGS